ncbi:Protein of unknown function [Gryllus bimaculatus]|nr:Protein of unknown function [Gryllus bimaculatus]
MKVYEAKAIRRCCKSLRQDIKAGYRLESGTDPNGTHRGVFVSRGPGLIQDNVYSSGATITDSPSAILDCEPLALSPLTTLQVLVPLHRTSHLLRNAMRFLRDKTKIFFIRLTNKQCVHCNVFSKLVYSI